MMRPALTVISFLLLSTTAQAHVVAKPDHGPASAWFRTNLIVGHGCNGKTTTSVSVSIPKDILIIKPQAKPGWAITIDKQALKKPIAGPHGSTITEVTTRITWTGTLPHDYFDEFGLSMKLPDQAETLHLPVLQRCGSTDQLDWHQIPAKGQNAHDLPTPAPQITVTPAKTTGHHQH